MKKMLMAPILMLGVMSLFVARRGHAESSTGEAANIGGDVVSIMAAGRGRPAINLSDGRILKQTFAGDGSLVKALVDNAASPRSLATADFDEDGTPDLVSGYGKAGGGILTFARGNVDAVYSNSPDARKRKAEGTFTGAPFLPETKTFVAPEAVDFLGAGDFDADGHWDVVGAAKGSRSLFWMTGDGRGNFGAARLIELDGAVTALTAGEINRADGLNEVIVGVDGVNGAKVLVFEDPTGALRGNPEVFATPAPPTSLAIGHFDGDSSSDLAVGGGSTVFLIAGRDRKLSHLSSIRDRVRPPEIRTVTLPFEIEAIAGGNFIQHESSRAEIALLSKNSEVHFLKLEDTAGRDVWKEDGVVKIPQSAASSNSPRLFVTSRTAISSLDALLVNTGDNQLHVLASQSAITDGRYRVSESPRLIVAASLEAASRPVAALPMRLNVDALKDLVILTESEVAPSIIRTEQLLAGVVTNTLDSGPGSLRHVVDLGAGLITFDIPGTGPHTITLSTGLPLPPAGFVTPQTIDATTQPGFSGSPVVIVNGASLATNQNALTLMSDVSVVRGLAFVNSPTAIYVTTVQGGGSNIVEGNYIGVMPNGTTMAMNAFGVRMERTDGNLIGGTTAAARNVMNSSSISVDISGNNAAVATGNAILGNYIGTNAAGTAGTAQGGAGIQFLPFARENTIGGTVAGARNVISRITTGISIWDNFNLIQGNYIGTNASGVFSIPNITGIGIGNGAPSICTIGGTTPAARNIISGNTGAGIILGPVQSLDTGDHKVQGNWIGTSVTGSPLPNSNGINLFLTNALVGGTVPGAANLIAHNRFSGINNAQGPMRVAIIGNSIHSNTLDPPVNAQGAGLGIDLVPNLSPFGVTPNDLNDPDTGPNDLQNFPVITSATSSGGSTNIVGSLNSRTDGVFTQFRIEFFSNPSCDPSGYGEGRTFIGATEFNQISPVFTAAFDVTLPVSVPGGSFITATATRNFLEVVQDNAMTSELSQCFQTTSGTRAHRVTDFNGNGTSDLALFSPSSGDWFIRDSLGGTITNTHFGATGDVPQPADYDGDGKTDIAVYRPGIGFWFVLRSSDSVVTSTPFGLATDKPVAADYDGDGRAELAVFRPSTGFWHMFNVATSSVIELSWGLPDDKPAPQDYDGDGRADLAVFRPADGTWYIVNSNDGSHRSVQWGLSEDKPVAGDYDRDGRADIAVWRPSSGVWYALRSTNNSLLAFSWGTSGDVPQPGDINGDFQNDFIVWRPSNSTWYLQASVGSPFFTATFGVPTDLPATSPYRIE